MRRSSSRAVLYTGILGIGILAELAGPALADPDLANNTTPTPGTDIMLELGAAARVAPAFPGADNYTLYPAPIIKLRFLKLPIFGTVADSSKNVGLAVYPAFNFEGERDAADHSELKGLRTVKWAIELGAGVRYTGDFVEAYAEVRRGFNGHHGFVGELGIDAVARPSDRLKLKLGPRLSFADSEYMSTYFGVSSGEATASGGRLSAYDAGGGFRDVGLQFGAEYAWSDRITLYGDAGYRRLVGDAADSPIVKRAGSENQFTAGLGLTYRFSWNVDGK